MTTYIFNASNKCVSQSRNLAGLFTWARQAGGVLRMECHTFPGYALALSDAREKWITAARPTGYLIAHLANGHRAETWFADGSHLIDWARGRAKPRRNSWFSGALIEIREHTEWCDLAQQTAVFL